MTLPSCAHICGNYIVIFPAFLGIALRSRKQTVKIWQIDRDASAPTSDISIALSLENLIRNAFTSQSRSGKTPRDPKVFGVDVPKSEGHVRTATPPDCRMEFSHIARARGIGEREEDRDDKSRPSFANGFARNTNHA